MREYYLLTYANRADLQSVVDRDLGSFVSTRLWTGTYLEEPFPSDITLFVDDLPSPDILGNPISWLIVSDKLLLVLQELSPNGLQTFAAPLYRKETNSRVDGFHIVNICHIIDAIVKPLLSIQTLVLSRKAIKDNDHVFRLAGHESLICVSDAFLDSVKGKGFLGLALLKTKLT